MQKIADKWGVIGYDKLKHGSEVFNESALKK